MAEGVCMFVCCLYVCMFVCFEIETRVNKRAVVAKIVEYLQRDIVDIAEY